MASFSTIMMSKEYNHFFRIVIIGDSRVGKSALLSRFTENIFPTHYKSSLYETSQAKTFYIVQDEIIKLERDSSFIRHPSNEGTFRNAHGFIILYDVTNKDSFDNIKEWLKEINTYAPINVNKILVGSKSDMKYLREVPFCTAKDYAASMGMSFLEISSKDNINVKEPFIQLSEDMKNESYSNYNFL